LRLEKNMKKWLLIIIFIFVFSPAAFSQDNKDSNFIDYSNDDTNGSGFDEAIGIDDICNYSQCKTKDCLRSVFNRTVFAQELEYVTKKYGTRGKDWEITGQDEINEYTLTGDNYYDDLGIQVFSTGKTKVLHFDITSPITTLKDKLY